MKLRTSYSVDHHAFDHDTVFPQSHVGQDRLSHDAEAVRSSLQHVTGKIASVRETEITVSIGWWFCSQEHIDFPDCSYLFIQHPMPVVVGVLLTPVSRLLSLLYGVPNLHMEGYNTNLCQFMISQRGNVVVFPKYKPSHAKAVGSWRCRQCGCDQYVVCKENRICSFCGESGYYEAEVPSFHVTRRQKRSFNSSTVKRLSHFKNWLARLQGKERCSISASDIESIRVRYRTYPDSLSECERIRLAMKELGLQRYYNHVYYVMRNMLGYSMVEFRKINEARLVAMFMRIQEPFARIQRERTNMLSYQYLVKKFCELLGYKIAEYIPLLKSKNVLLRQDLVWRDICEQLGVPFYPSV